MLTEVAAEVAFALDGQDEDVAGGIVLHRQVGPGDGHPDFSGHVVWIGPKDCFVRKV